MKLCVASLCSLSMAVVSAYDISAAVAYSDLCCAAKDGDGNHCKKCKCGSGGEGGSCPWNPSHPEESCQCAEFVAHALCEGKAIGGGSSVCPLQQASCKPGTDVYASCHGYNLRMASELHSFLKNKKGWKESSVAHMKKGDAVFYYSPINHATIARSSTHINSHNNNRCGMAVGNPTSILTPPSSEDAWNFTDAILEERWLAENGIHV